jgi:ComF family protein
MLSAILKDIVFPFSCLRCRKDGVLLCDFCCETINVPQTTASQAIEEIDQIHSPFAYIEGSTLSKLLHLFKYQGVQEVCGILEKLIAHRLPDKFHEADLLVPIPLHPKRLRWRGFNQAAKIAKLLSKQAEIPVVPLLKRIRHTKPQAELSKEEREKNLSSAFKVDLELAAKPKNIVLVDDVTSTGSTLQECAKALRKEYDCNIEAFVIARA